jgi:hypothetical protein
MTSRIAGGFIARKTARLTQSAGSSTGVGRSARTEKSPSGLQPTCDSPSSVLFDRAIKAHGFVLAGSGQSRPCVHPRVNRAPESMSTSASPDSGSADAGNEPHASSLGIKLPDLEIKDAHLIFESVW